MGGSGGGSSCATYAGTAKTDSKIFVEGYGESGTLKGYAYTYTYGTATVSPGKSTTMSCFAGKAVCAQGNVPADYASGAGIGWNINQPKAGAETTAVITGSVTIQIAGAAVGMRIGLGGPVATDPEFCYTLAAADVTMAATGLTIPAASFKQYCYNAEGAAMNPPVAYAGTMIKSIQVSVPGDMAAAKTFDFCIVDAKSG
jgi:hypothetical protein